MEFNGTFFASIISFLVFVFVMNKLLYEPVHKIVKERNDFINGNYKYADENCAKADALEKEKDEKIIGAKESAREKYNEIISEYKDQKSDIIKKAQGEAHSDIDEAYANLNNVSAQAKENLKGKMTDLANDIVEKILGYRSQVQEFDNEKVDKILYSEKG